MDRDKVICNCLNITAGDIEDAIKNGATTFEDVQEQTGCSTICGSCEPDVIEIIESLK